MAANKQKSVKTTKQPIIKLDDIIEKVNTPYTPIITEKPKKVGCLRRVWNWITNKKK